MSWLILLMLFLGSNVDPRPPTGVEETCDDQYDECIKMCDEGLDEDLTHAECVQECKDDADICYCLP